MNNIEETIDFAKLLKYYMFENNLTGRMLAVKFGVHESTVSLWKDGKRYPPEEVISWIVNLHYTPNDKVQAEKEQYLDEFPDYLLKLNNGKLLGVIGDVKYSELKRAVEQFKKESV